jgi:hypothetical protein
MTTLFILIGQFARYWLDPDFRDECDLEESLEREGEDGPTVARILERMRRRAALSRLARRSRPTMKGVAA